MQSYSRRTNTTGVVCDQRDVLSNQVEAVLFLRIPHIVLLKIVNFDFDFIGQVKHLYFLVVHEVEFIFEDLPVNFVQPTQLAIALPKRIQGVHCHDVMLFDEIRVQDIVLFIVERVYFLQLANLTAESGPDDEKIFVPAPHAGVLAELIVYSVEIYFRDDPRNGLHLNYVVKRMEFVINCNQRNSILAKLLLLFPEDRLNYPGLAWNLYVPLR